MRASLHPASPRKAASTSAMTGWSAMAGASRSFDCVARRCAELAGCRKLCDRGNVGGIGAAAAGRHAANTALVGSATPGLTSTAGSGGKLQRR